MTPGTAHCIVCRGPLVVAGEGWTDGGTRYCWCPYCGAARDPAGTVEGQVAPVTPAERGR